MPSSSTSPRAPASRPARSAWSAGLSSSASIRALKTCVSYQPIGADISAGAARGELERAPHRLDLDVGDRGGDESVLARCLTAVSGFVELREAEVRLGARVGVVAAARKLEQEPFGGLVIARGEGIAHLDPGGVGGRDGR